MPRAGTRQVRPGGGQKQAQSKAAGEGGAPYETGAGGCPLAFINDIDFDLAVWYNRFNSLMCYLSKTPDAHKRPLRGRRFEE